MSLCLGVCRERAFLGALAVLGGGAFAYMAGPGLLIIGSFSSNVLILQGMDGGHNFRNSLSLPFKCFDPIGDSMESMGGGRHFLNSLSPSCPRGQSSPSQVLWKYLILLEQLQQV